MKESIPLNNAKFCRILISKETVLKTQNFNEFQFESWNKKVKKSSIKIKKKINYFIEGSLMANLTDDHVVEVIGAINIFDKKGDGKLPADKLVDCLRALGLNPLKSDVSKIVKDMQECNVQERIDVEDFLPIYEYFLRKKKPSFQELCDGLKALNPNEQVDGRCQLLEIR